MTRRDSILLAFGGALLTAGAGGLISFAVADAELPAFAWALAWLAVALGLLLFLVLLLTGHLMRTIRGTVAAIKRHSVRLWHRINPPPTYSSSIEVTPQEMVTISIRPDKPKSPLPLDLLCQVMPIPSGAVSATEPLTGHDGDRCTVEFPSDFTGMKFVPGKYHYWWTTRSRRNPDLAAGPELAGGVFDFDGRYRPTFRQRADGSISIFLRYPTNEQPVLHGCAVKPGEQETHEELKEEAFINHDDGIAEVRYPDDFRTDRTAPLPDGIYTFQWYRVQVNTLNQGIPPGPIAGEGSFEVKEGDAIDGPFQEDEWWPRYMTVGRQALLALRNLGGTHVNGFRCDISGQGVHYIADEAATQERLGFLKPTDLPGPSDKGDFGLPGDFDAPPLSKWALGEYTVTWYSWRELEGTAFGVEPYELITHRMILGPGGTVQIEAADTRDA